ncbi:hypothetical protein Csa_017788 [Cucumis sativus]|nr:hypothetical protein Csa_017788 [Cucumis sativus]
MESFKSFFSVSEARPDLDLSRVGEARKEERILRKRIKERNEAQRILRPAGGPVPIGVNIETLNFYVTFQSHPLTLIASLTPLLSGLTNRHQSDLPVQKIDVKFT